MGTDSTGLELFIIGANNAVYYQQFNSSGTPVSGSFLQAASGTAQSLTVGTSSIGPELFIIGTDHAVYYQQFNSSGTRR